MIFERFRNTISVPIQLQHPHRHLLILINKPLSHEELSGLRAGGYGINNSYHCHRRSCSYPSTPMCQLLVWRFAAIYGELSGRLTSATPARPLVCGGWSRLTWPPWPLPVTPPAFELKLRQGKTHSLRAPQNFSLYVWKSGLKLQPHTHYCHGDGEPEICSKWRREGVSRICFRKVLSERELGSWSGCSLELESLSNFESFTWTMASF